MPKACPHLVFLNTQNLTQRVHLPAHMLHHLVDGIDFDFAALIAVQSVFDGHVLGGLHQQGRVGGTGIGGSLSGEALSSCATLILVP